MFLQGFQKFVKNIDFKHCFLGSRFSWSIHLALAASQGAIQGHVIFIVSSADSPTLVLVASGIRNLVLARWWRRSGVVHIQTMKVWTCNLCFKKVFFKKLTATIHAPDKFDVAVSQLFGSSKFLGINRCNLSTNSNKGICTQYM